MRASILAMARLKQALALFIWLIENVLNHKELQTIIFVLTYYKGTELFCMAYDIFRFLGGDGKMYVQVSHSDRVFKALSIMLLRKRWRSPPRFLHCIYSRSHVRFPPFCRAGRSVGELIPVLSANVKAEDRQSDKRAVSV